MEALAGGWRKEAGWQPTWQDLGLGLCREGVSPETSGVFLRGFQRPQWQSQAPLMTSDALPCVCSSCSGAFSSGVLVQHLWRASRQGFGHELTPEAGRPCPATRGHTFCLGAPPRPHTLGHHFDAVFELWPGGAKGWLCRCPALSHLSLASGLSNLRNTELFLTLIFRLAWVESFVLFCSAHLVFFFFLPACWSASPLRRLHGWRCCTGPGGWQHCCVLQGCHACWQGTSLTYPLEGTWCNVYCATCPLPCLSEGSGLLQIVRCLRAYVCVYLFHMYHSLLTQAWSLPVQRSARHIKLSFLPKGAHCDKEKRLPISCKNEKTENLLGGVAVLHLQCVHAGWKSGAAR